METSLRYGSGEKQLLLHAKENFLLDSSFFLQVRGMLLFLMVLLGFVDFRLYWVFFRWSGLCFGCCELGGLGSAAAGFHCWDRVLDFKIWVAVLSPCCICTFVGLIWGCLPRCPCFCFSFSWISVSFNFSWISEFLWLVFRLFWWMGAVVHWRGNWLGWDSLLPLLIMLWNWGFGCASLGCVNSHQGFLVVDKRLSLSLERWPTFFWKNCDLHFNLHLLMIHFWDTKSSDLTTSSCLTECIWGSCELAL